MLKAAGMDTREDRHPGFLSVIGDRDFAVDGDMAKLMRGMYVVFQSEVGGAEFKAGAGKLMDSMSKLNAEAQGNTPLVASAGSTPAAPEIL